MVETWTEYFDEPNEQIALATGFVSGWKKLKPSTLPDSVKEVCKKEWNCYLIGFYGARAIQIVGSILVAKFGGVF